MLKIAKDLFDLLYPIGTYYETSNPNWTPSYAGGSYRTLEIQNWAWVNSDTNGNIFAENVGGGQAHKHNIATKGIYVWQRTA